MNTVFAPLAGREYEDAFEYYEAEASGQGERFRRAVWATIGIIEEHPRIGREVRPAVRKILVHGFRTSSSTRFRRHVAHHRGSARPPETRLLGRQSLGTCEGTGGHPALKSFVYLMAALRCAM